MAITRVGITTPAQSTASITITLPVGSAAGDYCIVLAETANDTVGANPAGQGWSPIGSQTGTGTAATVGAVRLCSLGKILDSTDIARGTVTFSDSGDHQYTSCLVYRGVDPITPEAHVSAQDVGTPATTSVSLSSVTTQANSFALACIATDRDSGTVSTNTAQTWSGTGAPGANADIVNVSSAGNLGGGLIVNEGTGCAAGSTSFTCSITSSIWTGRIIVLNPQIDQSLTPSLFTNSQTFFGPILLSINTLAPAILTNDQTFFGPVVIGPRLLFPTPLNNDTSFYSATLTNAVRPTRRRKSDLEFTLGRPFFL